MSPTLVPGDVVYLRLGDIVPADLRLLDGRPAWRARSRCSPASLCRSTKAPHRSGPAPPLADLTNCALMGTVVTPARGRGVVVATGAAPSSGRSRPGSATHHLETEFQAGLRKFSMLLVYVAAGLSVVDPRRQPALHRPILEALLFSLAIAVGITPQLLPAVVATSLAAGSRRLAARKVLVKRLVCIEDLGNVDVLFTDKTGTLTHGRISFMRAVGGSDHRSADVLRWGCSAETPIWTTPATSRPAATRWTPR